MLRVAYATRVYPLVHMCTCPVAGYILTTLTFGSGVVGLAGILHHFQMLRRGDHPPHTCGGVTLSFSAFMLKKVDEND